MTTPDQLDVDQAPEPAEPAAPRRTGRCDSCGRRTAVANLVSGPDGRYGPKCADKLGLIIRVYRPPARTTVPSLFPPPAQEAPVHKRFIVRRDGRTLIEGVRFSDGVIIAHYPHSGPEIATPTLLTADTLDGLGTDGAVVTWLDPIPNVPDAMQPPGWAPAELAEPSPGALPPLNDAVPDLPAAGHPITHAGPSPDAQ